ncbi:hypothetical protein ACIOD2_48330 [Amycolatopsis sp. NPDC088138]|uniref:MmyB family transcriptional regulator n=1 Tax=Amycolatopsis sp. NPDC088138 TaxID=3363938 RepID=UPI0038198DF9
MDTTRHRQRVRPATLRLLDGLRAPAHLLGRRLDVLACNRLAAALIADFPALPRAERNQARFVFTDPHARDLFADWPAAAGTTTALLHRDARRHPDDPALGELIGDLSIRSAEFAVRWAAPRQRTSAVAGYHHPLVGDLTLATQIWQADGDPDQLLVVQTAEPGSPSEAALALLDQLARG